MSGQDCFRNLRNIDPSVRVIVCSGFPKDAMIEDMKKEGALSFLKKPYMSIDLMKAVLALY
ncbi:MAG: response regulator [Planctomycetes bacterium]|nr:response regulator [Planctomycetota bacterium]